MENISQLFKNFYDHYDYELIRNAYWELSSQTLFSALYKTVPFSVEIRIKNDVLAMQIEAENIVSMELMTVVGFFFDHYSARKNCVWTKNPKKLKSFFREGISRFVDFGGKITFNLSREEKELILKKMRKSDAGPMEKYMEHFHLLRKNNWGAYERYVENLIRKEEEEKHVEEVTSMDLPMDWQNAFSASPCAAGVSAEHPADALVLSLNNLGHVDIEYMAEITGLDCKTVISALKGSIYQNPDLWKECFYMGWETADEYLSGRVVDKLKRAREANRTYKGYFSDNVEALEKVVPATVAVEDIYITLGSPWVPADVIDSFISELFNGGGRVYEDERTLHDEKTGTWKIPKKARFWGNLLVEQTYGTKRINALHIIERTLNMKRVVVLDTVKCQTAKSGERRVIDKNETLLAREKQKKLVEEFQSWVWKDEKRTKRLQRIYEDRYCSGVIRHYDGSFLKFPEMNPSKELFDYQKNAVARILFSPNTLLAHDVGAGKTYIMIASGMEMRRIGISKKNFYAVPNNLVGQWREMFLELYPKANVLCVEPKNFTPEKRQAVLADIRDTDYDAIIMAYSSFGMIPVSKEYYQEEIKERIDSITMAAAKQSKISAAQIKKREALQQALRELEQAILEECDILYFDDLGINTLFLDEAHNFKNVPVDTKLKNVPGISAAGSARCQDMMDKVRVVQKANDGRGVVFATGTPISNSLTDIFIMQKYLQNGELSLLGLDHFDSWVGMFAEQESAFEIDVDAANFRLSSRFTKFHNMPELSTLLSQVADFYQVDHTNGIPEKEGYRDIVITKTPELGQYLQEIANRAEDVRNRVVSPEEDNMLKITTDGRKAALDLRLVDPVATFQYQCKAAFCAETVFDIYLKTEQESLTQLIFCDVSTPKAAFNLYDEMKRLLVSMGMPPESIAYIHDAVSEKKRENLFEKVRKGTIRVLIGSTFKLGLGVNVQDKLFALHHLDVPWRPSDMIQREGRILRKGNQNKKVEIYRYITEGSFDAYSWQLLESKQRMISAILSGSMSERMCEEIADVVLDYAEVKAISVGNPLIKKRVEVSNELVKNQTLQRKLAEARQAMEWELVEFPHKMEHQRTLIEACKKDLDFYSTSHREYDKKERTEIRELIFQELCEGELCSEERKVCTYQGFTVVIPTNMLAGKAFVYLERNGRYRVEMSMVKSGTLVRIDHFLEELHKHLKKLELGLTKMERREQDIREELGRKDGYSDVIEELQKELKKIDQELGVKH